VVPNICAAFVVIALVENIMASIVVKVAKDFSKERCEKICPMPVERTRAVQLIRDIEIDVSTADTRNVSQWE
jgi:hypothetical protein